MTRVCVWVACVALLAGAGCCRLCDRWCNENHYNAGGCCAPCAPAPQCCPAGPVPAPPATASWQRSYPNACCQ